MDRQNFEMRTQFTDGNDKYTTGNVMAITSGTAGYEFSFFRERLLLNPFVVGAARRGGFEVLSKYEPWNWEPPSELFSYKGGGIGLGFSSSVVILKYLTLGMEGRYMKFNKIEVDSKIYPGYQLSSRVLTVAVKAGFRLSLKE